MTSFLPRTFQTRLLRYALSRVGLFDVDTLNLDAFDFGWRSPSTIRLGNVQLSKEVCPQAPPPSPCACTDIPSISDSPSC